jgi:hypothetical protein
MLQTMNASLFKWATVVDGPCSPGGTYIKSVAAVPMKFQCPTRVSKENWATLGEHQYASDVFDVMQTNQDLKVKRIDVAGGWGMDLKFKCCNSIKLISITGLRFLSYGPTIIPSCYHSNSSSAVTASAGFSPISGILLLSLSTAVTPLSPMSAIVCTVAGFTNMISASSASCKRFYFQRKWMAVADAVKHCLPRNFAPSWYFRCFACPASFHRAQKRLGARKQRRPLRLQRNCACWSDGLRIDAMAQ